MNNYSFVPNIFSTTIDDNSWSNIECNWSKFSFEEELNITVENSRLWFRELKENVYVTQKEDLQAENYITNIASHQKTLTENSNIKKKHEHLKATLKKIKDYYTSTCGKLDIKNTLESEITKMTSELKLQKAAYKIALQYYEKYFDFKVFLDENAGDLIVVYVKFNLTEDMEPFKVTIDRRRRKILGLFFKLGCSLRCLAKVDCVTHASDGCHKYLLREAITFTSSTEQTNLEILNHPEAQMTQQLNTYIRNRNKRRIGPKQF